MTAFNDVLAKIRRFLRDPDGNIWSDDDIRVYWNDVQIEIAQKIGYIERAHAYRYPPLFTFSYQWDWERTQIEGDLYQCLNNWVTRDLICCYPWEPGYHLSSMDTPDDGTRFSHPWESVYCSPAETVRIPLHAKFHKCSFAAFDEREVDPIGEREIAKHDPYYRTRTGEPINYYRPDQYSNELVLYPRPSSVVWDDASWLLTDASDSFGTVATDGITSYREDALDESEHGVVYDTIETENNLFMVFDSLPEEIVDDEDMWDEDIELWPPYMLPIVEHGTLERCYGADTDGFIPSLRDYWSTRKEIGIKAIKAFKNSRMADRDFQIGGNLQQRKSRHPRLPSEYPAQWP